MANLGNLALKALGIVGGLLAIFIGLIWLGFGFIAYTSVHIGTAGGTLAMYGAALFILFGLLAAYGSIVYEKRPDRASKLLLSLGIIGFFVGFAMDYAIMGGIMGLISWAIPATLMIFAGLIAWIIPQRLASCLPLLKYDQREVRLLARVLYGGLFAGGIVLLMGLLFVTLAVFIGFLEESKSDENLFSDALKHESYGAYDSALSVYDQIIARNESNALAWRERSYALEKLGRHSEAEQSYQRALQLEAAKSDNSTQPKGIAG
ncbi:MAG: hypothetical protein GYA29_04510 [Methanothrix sp.]|nr:hypothetical protein [Methanothrix sp.]